MLKGDVTNSYIVIATGEMEEHLFAKERVSDISAALPAIRTR